jgi:hypothetical protein
VSIDVFLSEKYDRRRNNCLHFAARAWAHLTGDTSLAEATESDMQSFKRLMRRFTRSDSPTVEPSIAVMENLKGEVHVGICLRRRLLHLDKSGAQFLPIETMALTHKNMRFYR